MNVRNVIRDAVCTACGCLCDDIEVVVADARVIEANEACDLGCEMFLRDYGNDWPPATIAGRAVTIDQAVDEAARILAAARFPLVYGLSHATSEAQRAAVAIGDWIGANIDTATSAYHGVSGTSFAGVGEVTCTLGEVRHRGDLVIFWGSDPAESHPRHFERYSLEAAGMFVPRGRADRTCVVVDVTRTRTAEIADSFLQIKPACDFEALWILRALVQGIDLDSNFVQRSTGVSLASWQDLARQMKAAHFGVLFFGDGLLKTRGRYVNADALMALTRDLNIYTRFVCLPMRGRGNRAGADDVLLWTTGYPFGVNQARGYPRFGPGEYTAAETLSRGEPDAALVVGSELLAELPHAARDHLATIPAISLDADGSSGLPSSRVAFRTAAAGLGGSGTMNRMDDVPLWLRSTVDSPLSTDAEILSRIEARVKALRGYGKSLPVKERTRVV
ncbi:MAG TPA: formylmethanofuran dehydrogenase subunit B [Pirellulales bacterium]|jgi:formylmethanofuran dehydrogenase subunit B